MLVLSRKVEEKIVINSNIVITVLSVSGDKVKIGIDAPKDVSVNREEVEKRDKETKRQRDKEIK